MTLSHLPVLDAAETAARLPFRELVAALRVAVADYATGLINAPERHAVPFPQGGTMLSMPATACDIGIHKLVNVVRANAPRGLPTINGVMAIFDGQTGQSRCLVDGPTVTARRTAAMSMLGIDTFLKRPPRRAALVGTGAQAGGHADALAALYPGLTLVVAGSSRDKAEAFARAHRHLDVRWETSDHPPEDAEVVITLTSSLTPVYRHPARPDRLVIGVGAYKAEAAEIHPDVLFASQVIVDDLAGARHEAGDLIQAGIDWAQVRALGAVLTDGVDASRPVVFKTVGCAAWDLAAARCIMARSG